MYCKCWGRFYQSGSYLKATHEGNVQDNSVISGNYTYSEALKYFWFMDGTPLGIKKTENSILQLLERKLPEKGSFYSSNVQGDFIISKLRKSPSIVSSIFSVAVPNSIFL